MTPEELALGFIWLGRNFYTKASIFTRFFHNFTHPLLYFSLNWGLRNIFENDKVEDCLPHSPIAISGSEPRASEYLQRG